MNLLEPKNLVLLGLGVLLLAGLASSLSRGAWFAALVAVVVVGLLSRFAIRRREHLIAASIVGVAILFVVGLVGVRQDIGARAGKVSLDHVSADQRWPQWLDGMSTAMTHFPSGSGLGTYGYATLPLQSSTRRSWFREAHNQYLEVLTESGLVGITILCVGIFWFTRASWRLLRTRKDHEKRSWGLLGIALLVCGGLQSVFDFVLVIPANLMLYAGLIAIVGSIERATASDSPGHRSWIQSPALCCGVAACCLFAAYRASSQQIHSAQVLATASVGQLESQPAESTVTNQIAALTAAIEKQPRSAALYHRRAHWHLAAYRNLLLESAVREGTAITWENTQLENVYGLLSSQDDPSRRELLESLRRTPEMRSKLADATADLSVALALNPLTPRVHLTAAVLAPLTGMPQRPWLESSAGLANNSAQMLYLNGLFALQCDEVDLAIDQWSKSLAINHTYLSSILSLAQRKLPAIRVAKELVPSNRTDLLLELVRDTALHSSHSGVTAYDRSLCDAIVSHLESEPSVEPGRKHATIAQLQQMLGDEEAAVQSWEAALKVQARDPAYRLEYSHALRRVGRNDEALKQAVLGRTLNPSDKRFDRLASRIRQAIRLDSRR